MKTKEMDRFPMMNNENVADLLLLLLRDTRTYHDVQFATARINDFSRHRYAVGLWLALPGDERAEVSNKFFALFNETNSKTDLRTFERLRRKHAADHENL